MTNDYSVSLVGFIKKSIFLGGILFATKVLAYSPIDESELRRQGSLSVAATIAACVDEGSADCEDMLSLFSLELIKSARWAIACIDISNCKNSSLTNFIEMCSANAECNGFMELRTLVTTYVTEECILDPECKATLRKCGRSPSCKSRMQTAMETCFPNVSEDNSACRNLYRIFPKRFLNKIEKELRSLTEELSRYQVGGAQCIATEKDDDFLHATESNLGSCYKNGEWHGQWEERYVNGNIAVGHYVHGKEHGLWEWHYADGSVGYETYVNGELQE